MRTSGIRKNNENCKLLVGKKQDAKTKAQERTSVICPNMKSVIGQHPSL